MKFLTDLARKIVENQGVAFQDTAVILPNKRAKRFLRKELAMLMDKPFFSPQIFDINDFIESLSPRKKAENIDLLLMLYAVYQKNSETKNQDFHTFLSWGKVFLQDINDIDLQMVDAHLVFQNLTDVKELEIYFGKEKLSANQEYYIRFYNQLGELYIHFTQRLEEENLAYQGAIYKDVALHINTYAAQKEYQRYIFAGLSVLSPSEFTIINHYVARYQAELYFDFDIFYVQSHQKIVQNLKDYLHLEQIDTMYDYYAKIPKVITEVSVSKQIMQVQYAVERIKEIEAKEGNLDDTVLVLADESLLLPFIHAYDCSEANLTMGYPLTETPAAHLLKTIFQLIQNANRFKELDKNGTPLFYHKDILLFLRNPLIKNMFSSLKEHDKVVQNFLQKGKAFFYEQEIPEDLYSLLPDLHYEDASAQVEQLYRYFSALQKKFQDNSLFFNSIFLIMQCLEKIGITINHIGFTIDFKTIDLLLQEQISAISVPMRGKYDQGLQVMGVLETRALDFKNVIILSLNEAILPMSKKQSSLILFDLKRYFNLPTYQQKDAVFSYHFFRLLQRAEQIYLIYNTTSDGTLAEKSRFISQLEFEVKAQKLEETIEMKKAIISIPPIINPEEREVKIIKNEEIIEKLKNFHYSPTSISKYISCPLQFYLSYIAGIKPPQEINEEVEQKAIGVVLHKVLEELFAEIIKFPEKKNDLIRSTIDNIDSILAEKFAENQDTAGMNQSEGKLYMSIELTKSNILKYLEVVNQELLSSGYQVLATEKELIGMMKIGDQEIHLKGNADRIDIAANAVRILDYKTGKVNGKDELTVPEDVKNLFMDSKYGKQLQLLMYACLFRYDEEFAVYKKASISSVILSFQALHKEGENAMLELIIKDYNENNLSDDLLAEFEDELKVLLQEILDMQHPFNQTDDSRHCTYCDYREFCGRVSSND